MRDWKKYVEEHLPKLPVGPERELQIIEELAQHLDSVYQDALIDGATESDAFNSARAVITDWRLLECELALARKREIRSRPQLGVLELSNGRRGSAMNAVMQDLRYAVRTLGKSKGFTAIAVLSLALGIGANCSLFTLIDAVLLKMLPVRNPQELVLFDWLSGRNFMARSINGSLSRDKASGLSTSTSFSYDAFNRFQTQSKTLSDVIAFAELEPLNVKIDGPAEIASAQVVSGNYYEALGVSPLAGRAINPDDTKTGAAPVAVIGYRYWHKRFADDVNIIGKTVSVNGVDVIIVGVAPRGFDGTLEVGSSPDFSLPLSVEPSISPTTSMLHDPGTWWLQIIGRLRPGVSREQTRADLEAAFQDSARQGYTASLAQAARNNADKDSQSAPKEKPDIPTLRIESGGRGLNEQREEYQSSLSILMAVMGVVLLIACCNVAMLQLSRAAARQREIAIRLSLGASRWRLVKQLLTESIVLAMTGGVLGLFVAYWGKDVLSSLRPWGGPALELDLRIDLRVIAFTFVLSLVTGVGFGLVPALRATNLNLVGALKDTAVTVRGGRFRLTKGLAIAQVAMSLLLLIGTGLFLQTLVNLHRVDLGFNPNNVMLFKVDPRRSGYKKEQLPALYERLLDKVNSVPGVLGATVSRHPLLSGSAAIGMAFIDGKPAPDISDPMSGRDLTWMHKVGANFLPTMGIPIMSGRNFAENDDSRSPKVAIINQTMARKYFGDEDPIGKRLGFERPESSRDLVIVGVARDAKYSSIRRDVPNTVYLPFLQYPEELGQMNFDVRTSGDPSVLAAEIRRAVGEIDSNLPLFEMKTQIEQAEESLSSERLFAMLSSSFSILAVFLASFGLYGVMSFAVSRRTSEIGIRMALGARAVDVSRMVLRETMIMTGIGMIIGLAVAIATTRFLESMLYGLTPTDVKVTSAAAAIMFIVAGLAGYIPSRRAASVDPMVALRQE